MLVQNFYSLNMVYPLRNAMKPIIQVRDCRGSTKLAANPLKRHRKFAPRRVAKNPHFLPSQRRCYPQAAPLHIRITIQCSTAPPQKTPCKLLRISRLRLFGFRSESNPSFSSISSIPRAPRNSIHPPLGGGSRMDHDIARRCTTIRRIGLAPAMTRTWSGPRFGVTRTAGHASGQLPT